MDIFTHIQRIQRSSKLTIWNRILYWIHIKRWTMKVNRLITKGYIKEDYEPLKCTYCKSINLRWDIQDTIEHITIEQSVICNKCKKQVAYWINGRWDVTIHEP